MIDEDPLLEFYRANPVAARYVIDTHVLDASGHCQLCRCGGDSTGRSRGCTLRSTALRALDIPRG